MDLIIVENVSTLWKKIGIKKFKHKLKVVWLLVEPQKKSIFWKEKNYFTFIKIKSNLVTNVAEMYILFGEKMSFFYHN